MTEYSSDKADRATFEDLLRTQGYIVYTSSGRSMLPLLREKRDIVEIRAKAPGRCKKYDVVLYKRRGAYILHRVLKALPDGYLIAGDNNTFVERDVTDDMILGVMTRVIRGGRSVPVTAPSYRIYTYLWCAPYPLRMAVLKALRRARAAMRRAKKAVTGKK